jgi:hypothetical protein
MKIKFIVLALFPILFFTQSIKAQGERISSFRESRWFVGGNLGLQFGTITILDISPYTGFKLTNRLSVGAGFTYQYLREGKGDYKYTSNMFGGRIFSSYAIIPEVFAYAEYEVLNYEVAIDINRYARKNVSSVLVGGGYRQMIGPNLYSDIMILWNLTESPDSRYTNPIYRIGMVIGF